MQQVGDWSDIRKHRERRADGAGGWTQRCDKTPRQTVAETFAFCWSTPNPQAPPPPGPQRHPPFAGEEEVPVKKVPLVGPEGLGFPKRRGLNCLTPTESSLWVHNRLPGPPSAPSPSEARTGLGPERCRTSQPSERIAWPSLASGCGPRPRARGSPQPLPQRVRARQAARRRQPARPRRRAQRRGGPGSARPQMASRSPAGRPRGRRERRPFSRGEDVDPIPGFRRRAPTRPRPPGALASPVSIDDLGEEGRS